MKRQRPKESKRVESKNGAGQEIALLGPDRGGWSEQFSSDNKDGDTDVSLPGMEPSSYLCAGSSSIGERKEVQ